MTQRKGVNYIEQGWNAYARLLPPNCSSVQIRETRQAFYAGAAVLFEAIMQSLSPGEEPTEQDFTRMDDIHRELGEFGAQLDQRYLRGASE